MLQYIFKLLWTVKFDCILDFGWKFTAMSYMLGFTIQLNSRFSGSLPSSTPTFHSKNLNYLDCRRMLYEICRS